jgi:hypothetical protein
MSARLQLGWVTEDDLLGEEEPEAVAEGEAEAADETTAEDSEV